MARKPQVVAPTSVRHYEIIELKDKKYKLAYDFGAIMAAEDIAKEDLFDRLSESIHLDEHDNIKITKLPSARPLAALLFASLLPAQPSMTFEQAASLIGPLDRTDIFLAVVKAWYVSDRDPIEPADASSPVEPVEQAAS